MFKKTCNECSNPIFSKGLCKFHWSKLYGKKISKISKKGKKNKEEKKNLLERDKEFYLSVWEEREHICYECGILLPNEPSNLFFHHILPKSTYKDLRHISDNIVILCTDCHSQVETFIDKTPKVKLLTEQLKEKYDI